MSATTRSEGGIFSAPDRDVSAPDTSPPHSLELPPEAVRKLAELCRRDHISPPVALVSLYAILHHRYTGRDELLLEGWTEREAPFRLSVDLADDPSFAYVLSRLCARTDSPVAAIKPGDTLANGLQPARKSLLSGHTTLTIPPDLHYHLRRPEAGAEPSPDNAVSLALSFNWHGKDPDCSFQCSGPGLDEAAILRFVSHFSNLMQDAAVNPGVPISQLQLLNDAERDRLLFEWNDRDRAGEPGCIHDLFELQASRTPDAIAILGRHSALTYGELNSRANRVARGLRAHGVHLETLVGLLVPDPFDAIVSILAILKSGGAYVPLDLNWQPEYMNGIIADAALTLIVTSGAAAGSLPEMGPRKLLFEDLIQSGDDGHPSSQPVSPATKDNAAYVIYTSGSTGKPKAILGLHRCITSSLTWAVALQQKDVYGINGSFTFGSSVLGLFFPLLCGNVLAIIPSHEFKDPSLFAEAIEALGINRIGIVPPQLRQILNSGPRVVARLASLASVVVSGAVATPDLVDAFFEALPAATLINAYSSIEVGTNATRKILTRDTPRRPLTIGTPVPNTRVYILDRKRNPVPIGVTGELYVGTSNMVRGYLNRPALTQERFLPDPFVRREGARMYKTGDHGRFLPNGEIEFVGRDDNQVKIRGIRVELEEVESALQSCGGVKEALAGAPKIQGLHRLVAYIVRTPGAVPTVHMLQKELDRRVPQHMIPSRFVFLDRLPRTPNGKFDRKSLPVPNAERPELDTPYEAPRDALESALADIWSKVFGLEPVGVHDHFMELGGDSLLAATLARAISDRFEEELPIETIFDYPTIAELAAAIPGRA